MDDKINQSDTVASQPLPPIDFAHDSVIGNIGAPLQVEGEDVDIFDDDEDIKEVPRESQDLAGIQMVTLEHDDEKYPSPQSEDNIGFVI